MVTEVLVVVVVIIIDGGVCGDACAGAITLAVTETLLDFFNDTPRSCGSFFSINVAYR